MRKKLITMGLVSALGASTSAWAIDLDDATATPDVYAADAVLTSDLNADGNIVFGTISLIETTALGVGVASGNQIFVRVDLTNAEFDGAVTATMTVGTTSSTNIAQGGADGGTFVIFDVTSNGFTQASTVDFAPSVGLTGTTPSVAMTVYETLTQAVNQTGSLYTVSGVFASSGAGVAITANTTTATAEVSTTFTEFTGGTTGTLGSISYALSATATDPTDNGALADGDSFTAATSTVSLIGDVSFGDWYFDTGACGGAPGTLDLVENATTFDSATPAAASIAGFTAAHLVCVDVDGTEEINEGAYTVSFGYDTPATAVNPLEDSSTSVGAIARNGTTVQIPYLTTFSEYNQRLVIVNRGATDAIYNITFTTEDGTTATAGTAASGTVPAGEVLSLRATDIVSTAGATRTAATLTIVAPSTVIDVATNQVNLSDGSTDTVKLN